MNCSTNQNMKHLAMEMHVSDLAEFMFIKNVNNALIELELGGIQDNKDFFFFLIDLFCKGLVLLFGKDNKVNIDELTMEDFAKIKEKMGVAGINVTLNIVPDKPDEDMNDIEIETEDKMEDAPDDIIPQKTYLNIKDLEMEDNNKRLNEYIFKMKMSNLIYNISFDLIHRM